MAPTHRPATAPTTAAAIALTPTDVRLLDAPPILALLRLEGTVGTDAVRRAVARHVPRRFSAALVPGAGPAGPALRVRDAPGRPGEHPVPVTPVDVAPGALDGLLTLNVPVRDLAAIGLGDGLARDPLCTVAHVRDATGDALAVRLSHAAGDGLSLLRMLGAIAADLADDPGGQGGPNSQEGPDGQGGPDGQEGHGGPDDPDAGRTRSAPGRAHRTPARDASGEPLRASTPTPSGDVASSATTTAPPDRWLSVLPLSDDCRAEIADLAAARVASPTVCRMAVVARRLAPIVRPGGDGLRIRIPVDLRFRDLGIPADAVGNHWFDALAVFAGAPDRLPPAAEIARAIDATIRERVALLAPDDVDHLTDVSLRLVRDVEGEPLRRGVDLVHSSLPTPDWPGVRALHVLGSALLGVVDQRGSDRVDLVTPQPLPAGVTAL
ncbi:hypothetical protein AB0L40_13775 [Patulibacter sp. NPDC049589]|uniref:hypothetical protein n=1 Tax=Patulibacter sp. NPDC049589 TaxID=3154731 RepID=UPI0034377202